MNSLFRNYEKRSNGKDKTIPSSYFLSPEYINMKAGKEEGETVLFYLSIFFFKLKEK